MAGATYPHPNTPYVAPAITTASQVLNGPRE